MPKQLYIPLPCAAAREQMIQRQLSGVKYSLSSSEQKKVVEKTEGYSGSDMKNLVQEACQGPVRDAIQHTRHKRSSGPNEQNGISGLSDSDLRPVVIKDFQVIPQVFAHHMRRCKTVGNHKILLITATAVYSLDLQESVKCANLCGHGFLKKLPSGYGKKSAFVGGSKSSEAISWT